MVHLLQFDSLLTGYRWAPRYLVIGESLLQYTNLTPDMSVKISDFGAGTISGYHAVSYGHLVGEIVRRVSGKSLRDFVQDEIARPLDADYQVGARESDWHRVAEIIPPPTLDTSMFGAVDPEGVMMKTVAFALNSSTAPNTPGFPRAQIGAINGHMNARAIGRIFSALVADRKQRLLLQQTIDRILEIQYKGTDVVTLVPICWGIGFGLSHPDTTPYIPEGRVIFWTGWGGSILLIDFEKQLVIGYAMNKMGQEGYTGSERTQQYVEAIYKAVQQKL
ncbi:hypothetical protein UA08_08211 [Talaromyces atroroseus]|uniref:Beta-lactamase-related domain-containing protein n=1 Tax=Talaromyces atroroseus TaxID=1441469 RepID=A0A225AM36_TALAT|nr:hypothetical protein UA08_08211 [Talaromyces atroroseus]OKL56629.1 hypothetical protein UA08_08211 [Talaromyces atroroseus]